MSETKISCPNCAQHIVVDDAWSGQVLNCPSCQQPFTVPQLVPVAATTPPPPPPSGGLRKASAPPPPLTGSAPSRPGAAPRPQAATQPTRTSGLAIASLVLSLLGCFWLTAIAGVICGHLARKRIRQDPLLAGNGLALAGLIIGYVLFAITTLYLTMSTILVVKGIKQAQEQARPGGFPSLSTNIVSERHGSGGVFGEKKNLPAPEGAVSGSIKGQTFTYSRAKLNLSMGLLEIEQGEGFIADQGVKIFLFPKQGESLANRTWKVAATSTGMNPHVHLQWRENGVSKSESFSRSYTMELKTGEITNGIVSGSITLKATGTSPVDLKGNFTAAAE